MADAPVAASYRSGVGEARSPRGAARCEECVGAVSLGGEWAEQCQQQQWHSCMGASHGGHGCARSAWVENGPSNACSSSGTPAGEMRRWRGDGEEEMGSSALASTSDPGRNTRGSEQGTQQQWWARSMHDGHVLAMSHPWRHIPEQVAVGDVSKGPRSLGQ
jgi:hypothetical protein